MRLPEAQVAVLEAASANEDRSIDGIAESAGLKPEAATGAAFALEEDGLLSVTETTDTQLSLTDEGESYRTEGLPEVRLYRAAIEAGADADPVAMGDVIEMAGLDGQEVDIALSNYARKGYGQIDAGQITADPSADADQDLEAEALAAVGDDTPSDLATDVVDQLDRRGLLVVTERTARSVRLSDDGVTALMEGVEVAETADRLTPDLLTSGEWRDLEFAEYNVEADAAPVTGGKVHVLRRTAERVKDVLVGMGFEEMAGPHADAEFWINDCLFMPQDHPARTHWDQFALDVPPMDDLPAALVERVRSAHKEGVGPDGDGYHAPWEEAVAREVDLRGHTTSLSMRYLSGHQIGELEPPKRFFSVEKVYR
ncbi:MAG: phenylalanine--tRNA ligase subunit alpha, partial [Halobacteriales archaeon]|nr:phenylalanine--tRNA ligase subunit alpha [Halobacteriales archaeon]